MQHLCLYYPQEASTIIRLSLKKEAGSLPVKGVDIEWELRNPDTSVVVASNSAVTKKTNKNGDVLITVSIDGLDSTKLYPLHVTPTKMTGQKAHEFLCNNEKQVCGVDKPVAFLSHLEFNKIVNIADKTSVPFRGKIEIQKDGYLGKLIPSTGCDFPLYGATVCLERKINAEGSSVKDSKTQNCVETNLDGTYELPATLGTTVYPEVAYSDHEFHPTKSGMSNMYRNGILISEEKYLANEYEGHNFIDNTTETLIVEVAGGLCNIPLGRSTIHMSIVSNPNCKWEFSQKGYQQNYTVPAHMINVWVTDLKFGPANEEKQRQPHLDVLINQVGVQTLDLTDLKKIADGDAEENGGADATDALKTSSIEEDEAKTNSLVDKNSGVEKEKEAAAHTRTARFQYNGPPLIFPMIETGKDLLGLGCSQLGRKQILGIENSYNSTHVIASRSIFELTIVVRQEVLREEHVYCDNLGDESAVSLQNEVGLTNTGYDMEILSLLEKSGADVSNYKRCTGGCKLPIVPPIEKADNSNLTSAFGKSEATVVLQAGIPKISGDFMKPITIQFGGTGHTMWGKLLIETEIGHKLLITFI